MPNINYVYISNDYNTHQCYEFWLYKDKLVPMDDQTYLKAFTTDQNSRKVTKFSEFKREFRLKENQLK